VKVDELLRSASEGGGGAGQVFCAGANIRMLAGATHAHKVNFCKFTNETRNGIEDSQREFRPALHLRRQRHRAGGGYELALATDHIILADDGSAAVALPEVPLLAVLPGTGGLTRVTDKRKVRRDHADFSAPSRKASRASARCNGGWSTRSCRTASWRPRSPSAPRNSPRSLDAQRQRQGHRADAAEARASTTTASATLRQVDIDRAQRHRHHHDQGAGGAPPADIDGMIAQGAEFWPLQVARELDDAILHLRINELETAMLVFKSHGDRAPMCSPATRSSKPTRRTGWSTRSGNTGSAVLKRIDVTSRTLVTLVEPGSCFAGTLAELVFAADRSYMLIGQKQGDNRAAADDRIGDEFRPYPMSHGLTRLQSRFRPIRDRRARARPRSARRSMPSGREELGLVTFALDDIDWDDEIRVFLEERASFSPDGLTGMEANLRFVGPETMESKIFSRLTAWQNWIFQRPNAVGEEGALRATAPARRRSSI
jgi:benzoyl-CoA-dihydrodiol lyase